MIDNRDGTLLGIHALTSLHPGAGTSLGTIDLPVQRERHTQWPTIAASAMKGVLRDACREKISQKQKCSRAEADKDSKVVDAFGPPTAEADKQAGAISITDARLLAFPVRSLKGVFAWVTCPHVLERMQRDISLVSAKADWKIPSVGNNQVIAPESCPCLIEGQQVVLEEFDFAKIDGGTADHKAISKWIVDHLLPNSEEYRSTRERFERHFLILSDDDFTHFSRHATEVMARIGLNYETKTVKDGALFYQEFLPPETILYSVVLASPGRSRNGTGATASDVLRFLKDCVPAVLQIGGDDTTGKGFCAVRFDGKGA